MRRSWSVVALALAPLSAALAQSATLDVTDASLESGAIVPPTPVVIVPGAKAPLQGPFEGPAGPPAFRPRLPLGTPLDQVQRPAEEPVETLAEAIKRAYWTNPALLAERARTRSADFRLPRARAEFGPQLQYSGSYNYQNERFQQPSGSSTERSGWSSTVNAVLTQPLFTFGRLRAGEDIARGQIAFQRGILASTEQESLFNAVAAYATVLRDRAAVVITQSTVDLLTREFENSRIRLGARDITIAEVDQVQSRLELARAQLLSAAGSAAASDALFLRHVGAPAGDLVAPNPLVMPVQTLEDAYLYADANNPIIASAYARERVSRAQMEFAKAELLPRVDLRGQASNSTVTPYNNGLRQTELRGGVTISGTLDVGIRQARIGEASAANDADWRLIDDALRENRAELADAWNLWKSQAAAVESLTVAVNASQSALEGSLIQQRAGLRTTSEILELARDLLQVRSSLNSAMASEYVQQARVLRAMGALRQEYLMSDVQSYDADQHLNKVRSQGDVPILTSVIRALDSITTPPRTDRPIRDPAAPIGLKSADTTKVLRNPGQGDLKR